MAHRVHAGRRPRTPNPGYGTRLKDYVREAEYDVRVRRALSDLYPGAYH